jgi:hypothetical protein
VGFGKDVKEIAGVYSSLSANGKPVAGRVVLIKTPDTKVSPTIIKIHSKEYQELNVNHGKVAKFLCGETGNYIKSIRKNDFKFLANEQEFNIGEVLFFAGCYRIHLGDYKEGQDLIERSFYHGFSSKDSFENLLKKYKGKLSVKKLSHLIKDILP